MKRSIIWILIAMFMVSVLFLGVGCKEEAVSEEEAVEETAKEEAGEVAPAEEEVLTEVKIGISPYAMFMWAPVAHELGIDNKFGLNFDIFEQTATAPGSIALTRGDIDVSGTAIAEHIAAIEGSPTLKNFSSTGFFKGFFFIGRSNEIKPFEEIKKEMGVEEAKEFRLNQFKGKEFSIIPQRKGLIIDAVNQVGLTADDISFLEFADDQKAAIAFMKGSGDFYIGSLPQQQKLLDMGDEYINVGGSDILGPAGLWYDIMISTDDFMIDNREIAIRTIETLYRTIEEFDKDNRKFAEIASKKLSSLTGSDFSVETYIEFQTIYDDFLLLASG